MLNKKKAIAKTWCAIKYISKEKAVSSNRNIAEIFHFDNENRKYDVEAFTKINIGCIGDSQYDEIEGSSPTESMYIKGDIAAIITTDNLNMKSLAVIVI